MKRFSPPTEQAWLVALIIVGSCAIEAGWKGALAGAAFVGLMILLGWLVD